MLNVFIGVSFINKRKRVAVQFIHNSLEQQKEAAEMNDLIASMENLKMVAQELPKEVESVRKRHDELQQKVATEHNSAFL
jgi:hypothetical protein